MEHLSNKLQQIYQRFQTHADDIVLATIIETMGSTYQKAGARMLMTKEGELTGLLGGGCFEADLLQPARSVFDDGQAKIVFYDMRSSDDAIWGLGLGCNGAVRILLQLLRVEHDFFPLNVIANVKDDSGMGVLTTICSATVKDYALGHSRFFPAVKQIGQYMIQSDQEIYASLAQQVLLSGQSRLIEHDIDGQDVTVFYALLQPPVRLLLLGAGADAVPVTQFASALGWHVSVADYRDAYIKAEHFPDVDRLVLAVPNELQTKLPLNQFDAVVLMTHNIDYDERYLDVIADSDVAYIGLLGPVGRRDRLLDSLAGRARRIRKRVYGPVGLDIGASTPEEIALSVMAGIQAAITQRCGRQLDPKSVSTM